MGTIRGSFHEQDHPYGNKFKDWEYSRKYSASDLQGDEPELRNKAVLLKLMSIYYFQWIVSEQNI
jgi:hypothetical protein